MAQYFASNSTVLESISSSMGIGDASYYMRSNITTMVMNALVHDSYLISEEKLRNVGMQRLEHFYYYNKDKFKSYLFKGYDYYFMRLCGVPFHLRNLNIPKNHYTYFERHIKDPICGHPMASHGWYRESLDGLIEMGAYKLLEYKKIELTMYIFIY